MISDGEAKGSDPHGGGSHAFPLLKKKALIDPAGSSAEPGDCFKPLFNPPDINGNPSADKGIGVSCPGEDLNYEDKARRKGFERGFDAGKQEACSLIQEQMTPQIKSFADSFSLWNALSSHRLHIVQLGLQFADAAFDGLFV